MFDSTKRRPLQGLIAVMSMLAALSLIVSSGLANHGVFESGDGNLAPSAGHLDWNSFSDGVLAGEWNFLGVPDRTGNPDDIYNGGVKQDHDCPGVRDGSLGGGGGKFDLSRIYLANKNIDGNEFLFLAWIRVPQNSQTASSHVAYEFNKGENGLCAGNQLYKRTAGDMLVVYDFEGGSSPPTIKLARWKLAGSCEVHNQSPPCWGDAFELTANGMASAKVNTKDVGPVFDALANETLGVVEFGEAGIDLTAAGVFANGECEEFGHVTGVSRSSGNSGTAQMKDKVGPADFRIGNCGSVKVVKKDPDGNKLEGATFQVWKDGGDGLFGGEPGDDEFVGQCVTPATGACAFGSLHLGNYWVHETVAPPGYLADADNPRLVSVPDEDQVVVVFVNDPEPGRVLIYKDDDAGNALSGAVFALYEDADEDGELDSGDPSTGRTCTTDANGICREDGVEGEDRPAFAPVDIGFYCVAETSVPSGYEADDPQCFEVEVRAGGHTVSLTFTNDRLHKVIVVVCHEGTNTLAPSEVTDGTQTLMSIAAAPGGTTEAALCGLAGFGGKSHEQVDLEVDVGSDSH